MGKVQREAVREGLVSTGLILGILFSLLLYTHSYLPSVVSLMIDKRHTELCAVLLSTGQLNVIHLPSGATLFHK